MKLTNEPHLTVRGSVGPSCWRGGREELVRDRKDISRGAADCAPTCHASVACHVSQNGKNVRVAATVVLNL